MTIRLLGILGAISHESLEFQHLLFKCLKDAKSSFRETNQAELYAAVFSSFKIAGKDERFAVKLCNLLATDQVPPIPDLFKVFQCLKSISNMEIGMKQTLDLLNRNESPKIRCRLFKVRSLLAHASCIYLSSHVSFLIDQILVESSEDTCFAILECLVLTSKISPTTFQNEFLTRLFVILYNVNNSSSTSSSFSSARCKARCAEALFNVLSAKIASPDALLQNHFHPFLAISVQEMLVKEFRYSRFIVKLAALLLEGHERRYSTVGKPCFLNHLNLKHWKSLTLNNQHGSLVNQWVSVIHTFIKNGDWTKLHFELLWLCAQFTDNLALAIDTLGNSDCKRIISV